MNNLEIIKAYHTHIWELKDFSGIESFFHSDVLVHSPLETTRGVEHLISILDRWNTGFPDLHVSWDDFVCEGQKVVAQWRAKGTHTGVFLGIEPAGNTIEYPGVSLYELIDGKISQYWAYVDMSHIRAQLS